jgi:VanZ family protein
LALWLTVIFLFSSFKGGELPATTPWLGSVAHFFEYLVLGFLTGRAGQIKTRRCFCWALIFCLFYAASDEGHQSLVADRAVSLNDWLWDAGGSLMGLIFFRLDRKN